MRIPHTMILASAGSGKTYALTNRFVQLLAAGAAPERIVALTFTRKAAGEFFDEILKKLAAAACEPEAAAMLANEIEAPRLGPADFLRMLRTVIDAMPRLRLGTLDGFFARIARAFPLELGLGGEFEVLQEHAAKVERRRVLQRMFARSGRTLDSAQQDFIEAFKRATFGTEEKRLTARLDAFLDEYQETFLAAPVPELWGDAARVWPEGCDWIGEPGEKLAAAISALRMRFAGRELTEKQSERWEAFFSALPEWSPAAPMPRAISYLIENTLAVWPDVRRGAAEITVERKKMALDASECASLAAVVRHVFGAELRRRLETTRGIHAVLRGYEAVYHAMVRRAGRLTFGDVQRLLQPDLNGPRFAGASDAGAGRLAIDFRLDGRFDHWLLDEFQDTSFGQWSVLENLVDEAVQDPGGTRSFFCVGDVKQAIYAWREGDARLFREVFDRYDSISPGGIIERQLVQSWRSAPPVVAMVNAVFGRPDAVAALFPGPASDQWNREWRTHESARPQLTGHAAWLHAGDEPARFALTVRLLQEIAPLERGLDCAVLTQTNRTATALAEYLRREGGLPALAESDLHIATDNPLGAGLLALLQAAAHPGDTFAQRHLHMTPLRAVLDGEGIRSPEEHTRRVLAQIHGGGFERTLEYWLRRAETVLPAGEAFNRNRARQLLAAAALFDATGSRDVAEFTSFMARHAVRGVETAGVVRVMTIHKAKGLGFDVAILPDLEGQSLDQRRDGLAMHRSPAREVEWVLDLPTKLFVENDAVLRAHVRDEEAVACHEALALLYVAMTRAKRAMYAITSPAGTTTSRNYPRLLGSTMGSESQSISIGRLSCAGTRAWGNPSWHAAVTTAAEPRPATSCESILLDKSMVRRAPRRPARRPSAERERSEIVDAPRVFAPEATAAVEYGRAIHSLLAEVEWAETADVASWRTRGLPADAVAEAIGCVGAPELASVWAHVRGAEVWRERAFEMVLDGAWVTGVFDRVVLQRGEHGRAERATVHDFKTDRLPSGANLDQAVSRHAGQLALYCRAVAVLAGLRLEAVSGSVVFTGLRQMVRVTPS
ncbi:MAG: UvrD-helicase domain-containing protein [Opitutaceae bacterium]|nr:UvrD-helicase domain-containing protein [Opitutaceae bacterium]